MSSQNSTESTLSKGELQALVTSNDSSISFIKPANRRSNCWTNYTQIYHENNPQDYIICLQCRIVLKWTKIHGTRGMTHHKCSKNKPISATPSQQQTISSYCRQPSSSKEYSLLQKRITEACVEYCAVDGRSFESVARTGFLNLANQLINAGATLGTSVTASELLPHSTTISDNVERVFLNLKKQLICLCERLKDFCITCDFWSAKITDIHYGALTLHYIDEQWQLRVFTLSCEAYAYESQHAINLRSVVNKILEEFGLYLNDNMFIVTGNENKIESAFQDDVKRIGCGGYFLNKILQQAFINNDTNCDAAQLLFKIVRTIITDICQCHKQPLLSTSLQNYSDIRLDGIYLMFDSFLKVYYELPEFLSAEQKRNYSKVDRDSLESLCIYLKNFYDVMEKLRCEKTPTLHLVIPYKQFLINLSDINDNDEPLIIPLKKYIGNELPSYWVVDDVHYIATMLHPNLKSFNHTPHEKYRAEALLKSKFNEYQNLEQKQLSSDNSNKRKQLQQQKKTQLPLSLDDIFDLPISTDELQDATEVKTEFNRYIKDETKIDKNMNVLMYWNDNKSLYPTLAKIAQCVLSIPATNISVERLFSDNENTITNHHTRLDTSKANQLLFIRRNLSTLKELFPSSIEQLKKRKNSGTSTTSMKYRKYSTGGEDDDSAVLQDDLDNTTFDDDPGEKNNIVHFKIEDL